MAEENGAEELNPLNGEVVPPPKTKKNWEGRRLVEVESFEMEDRREEETFYGVLHRFFAEIFFSDPNGSSGSSSLLERAKASFSHNAPLLREGFRNTSRDLLLWTRQGSPLRAILVVSVGTIILLAMTGLLVFMLFFLVATVNAVVISLLISLAAAGGFLAIFFACVVAIYIGALSVAALTISTATVSTIIAVVIATAYYLNPKYQYKERLGMNHDLIGAVKAVVAKLEPNAFAQSKANEEIKAFRDATESFGMEAAVAARMTTAPCWIGFFWAVWFATMKGMGLAKHSLGMTGSALLAYSAARRAHRNHEADKVD